MNEHQVNEIMDCDELAIMLKSHKRQITEMSNSGDIPATKIGKKWIYLRGVILKWLEQKMLDDQSKTRNNKMAGCKTKEGYQPTTLIPSATTKMEKLREKRRG